MKPSDLISPAYLDEQETLHAHPRGYGQRGRKWADTVVDLATRYQAQSILDYGCGQGSLGRALAERGLVIREYDPAIPGKRTLPTPADLVVCTDVLEHIEPDRIWTVAEHLSSVTRSVAFVVISLVEASKHLSDGRQAHILLRSVEWWRTQLRAHDFAIADEPTCKKPHKEWAAVLEKTR